LRALRHLLDIHNPNDRIEEDGLPEGKPKVIAVYQQTQKRDSEVQDA
jgi:hypothetical protein